jgi:pimeloyl-ACP methyl ester carboxylesterase
MTALEPEFVASADGTRIAYRRVGAGPPVVALHGGLGSWRSWLAVAERLADRFELFLVDRRGRGASGDGASPHSLAREVEDARAILAVAGAGGGTPRSGPALIGHSYGGAIALEVAREARPGQIGRLVVYEPGVGVAGLIPAAQVRRMDELIEQGQRKHALGLAIQQLDEAGLVSSSGATAPDALCDLAWTMPREIRALDVLGSDVGRYATVSTPTLLLAGAASPRRARRTCEALAAAIPDIQVAWLDGLGHVAHNAAPDKVAAIVGPFLGARGPSAGLS